MIGCLPTQALAFLAVFLYATHRTQRKRLRLNGNRALILTPHICVASNKMLMRIELGFIAVMLCF